MKDIILQDIEKGDFLFHISQSKRQRKPLILISMNSLTPGGKLRVMELCYGHWNVRTVESESTIKISKEKVFELLEEHGDVAYSSFGHEITAQRIFDIFDNKSEEIK